MATATDTTSRQNAVVARLRLTRRLGPVGAALTIWDIWRRLPPRQRRFLVKQARKHGPRIARQMVEASKKRRR
jgi:hypothetical protein